MTSENTHINSFMYEPILDMDIDALEKLYKKVKCLNSNDFKKCIENKKNP